MFSMLNRRIADARSVVGNVFCGVNIGTLTQNFFSGAPSQTPSLIWDNPPEKLDEVYKLLSWHVRLTCLIGRAEELAHLHSWLTPSPRPRVRFLSGPGGAGKTRLAAELADMSRTQGWTAGFWRLDKPAIFPITREGLLLIIDYPEEDRSGVRSLLADLSNLETLNAPIRVLFLTRMPMERWHPEIDAAGAASLVEQTPN